MAPMGARKVSSLLGAWALAQLMSWSLLEPAAIFLLLVVPKVGFKIGGVAARAYRAVARSNGAKPGKKAPVAPSSAPASGVLAAPPQTAPAALAAPEGEKISTNVGVANDGKVSFKVSLVARALRKSPR